MGQDQCDIKWSKETRDHLAHPKSDGVVNNNVGNNLADIFLFLSNLRDISPYTAAIDLIEKNVHSVARELYRLKDELRKLKGES